MLDAAGDEAPLAVILTPGPYNETYFEHAYLARQLGMPLVEGHDLTVRGDTVFLKTLGGLRRVHSILRRLDDDFCDPLELRGDSALGVPGLIGALRAGRVMVSNALGTGVLESAAWLGFLPPIAERLIGEKLLLPEIATWWLGEKPALEYVLANLDRLVIKPTYPNQRFEPMFGREFEGKARDLLIERLRNRPYAYVAQEHVRLSQAPVWKSAATSELGTRALTIRVYAVVTPDGRARDARRPGARRQRSGGRRGVDAARRRRQGHLGAQRRIRTRKRSPRFSPGKWANLQRQDYIPSRLVENLFWLGRYTVRCENTARLLLRTLAARSDARVWAHARQICRDLGAVSAETRNLRCAAHARFAGVAGRRQTSRLVRIAGAQPPVGALLARRGRACSARCRRPMATRGSSREVYERVLLSLAALTGFSEEDMMHDEGWRVMRLGRRIERMQFVASILVRQLESPHATRPEAVEWLLDVCDSTPIYRARYLGAPRLSQMLNLLLYDDGHPDGAGVPSPLDRSRPRRPGAQPGRRTRARRARRAAAAAGLGRTARRGRRRRRCSARRSGRANSRALAARTAESVRPPVAPLLRADRIRRARAGHVSLS